MYGREADFKRLNEDRNNPKLSKIVRQRADKAYKKIAEQVKDKKLMRMREQLIRATQAADEPAQHKIQMQIRDYQKQDKETGQYVSASS